MSFFEIMIRKIETKNKMKASHIFVSILLITAGSQVYAQRVNRPQLDQDNFTTFNREASYDSDFVHLNAAKGYGILWLNEFIFKEGTIELDIKGRNKPGQSFVGLAFLGTDDKTFDAIYFRPFNFKNPDRNGHSVQYISMPEYDWYTLRESSPGEYENKVSPLPDPEDDWFHVKMDIDRTSVKVYVNDSNKTTLEVERLNKRSNGSIGFWVGNNSEGWFRNLVIKK